MWTETKKLQIHAKIRTEAKKLAKKLGAHSVYVVAHFVDEDGNLHSMRGGQLPMPESAFYRRELMLYAETEAEETIPEGEPH
jgi:hypothetical protein